MTKAPSAPISSPGPLTALIRFASIYTLPGLASPDWPLNIMALNISVWLMTCSPSSTGAEIACCFPSRFGLGAKRTAFRKQAIPEFRYAWQAWQFFPHQVV